MIRTFLFSITSALVVFSLIGVSTASAKSVVRSGDVVSVAEEQVIEGDFYSAAGTLNVSGTVNGDALLLGGQVNVNGTVLGDVLVVGGSVDVAGSVADDVRVLSGEVTISEPVQGDLFVVGGVVNVLSTASVAGDVVLFGGQTTIEGSVGGNILGNAESIRIDSAIAGDIDVTVNQLTLGDKANISGSVRYTSAQLAVQALNANVSGELVRNDPILPAQDIDIRSIMIPVLILLFSVLAWYLASRRSLTAVVQRSLVKSPRPIMIGATVTLIAPLAIGLLLVSMIGTLVGFALLFGYLLIMCMSFIGVSAVIGQLMMKLFNQPSSQLSLMSVVVGVVGVTLLMLLPIIGQVVILGFMILTIGAIVDLVLRPKVE